MKSAYSVLSAVENNALYSAKHGLELLASKNPKLRMAGLRNVAVFGRAVTFGIQNLRSTEVDKERFEEWYASKQEEMRADPIMKYFVTVRNEIEKQGEVQTSVSIDINGVDVEDIIRQSPPPQGNIGFFMGDMIGGSGYMIDLGDGCLEKYYIEIPENIPASQYKMTVLFAEAPEELKNQDVVNLSEHYVQALEKLLKEAKATFL